VFCDLLIPAIAVEKQIAN
jgi:hypothetical protein